MAEDSAVGKRITRIDSLDKVTGKALYAADIILPNMLHGKILRSPHAHARIRRIDVSKALALEGVMAVITGADVPDKGQQKDQPNPMMPFFALKRAIYAGQPVAAVAARTPYIAEDALKLINVDYEVLPCVTDVLEAVKPGALILHAGIRADNLPARDSKLSNVFCYWKNGRGDIDAGFKEADVVLENTFRTQTVHQGYIEPRAALASVDAQGRITVWTDNQSIFVARGLVSEFMDVPLSHVKVIPVEIGGAFGGKEPQILAPICALLSSKAGQPVRIVLSREEVFKDSRPAPASAITVRMGATRQGKITAVSVTMFFDYGCLFGVDGLMEFPWAVFTALSPYRIPNLHIESYSVFTNKAPSGPYRSPTAPSGAFAIESQIDLIARELDLDALDLRLQNVAVQGDHMLMTGGSYGSIGFRETLEKMKQHLAGRPKPEGENRGRGIACGFWSPAAAAAGASINLNQDGTVQVVVGCTDISGSRTGLAQIAAGELGIPFEHVSITIGDTDTAPYSSASVGSLTTRSTGTAISHACQDMIEQLCQRGASHLKLQRSEVEYVDGAVRARGDPKNRVTLLDLAAESVGFAPFNSPIIGRGAGAGQLPSPVLAVQAADVEVDKDTGKVRLLALAVAQDTGLAVNPLLIEGQMQGAATQSVGWALHEGYIFLDGVMQNCGFLDYRIPTAADMPFIDTLIVEVKSATPPLGIRGAGEPPMVPGLAALANAVHSATGARITELPMSPEAILNGIKKQDKPKKR